MLIRTLIVDDEPLARRRIRSLLGLDPDVEVVGEVADGRSAVNAIREQAPELVFLDVQMPELDGFGVLRSLQTNNMPLIVFVTAYDRYAVQAFETHAVDYLLKPFKRDRFLTALQRAKTQIHAGVQQNLNEKITELIRQETANRNRLLVRSGGRILFLGIDEIDWIEADGNYVRLQLGTASHLFREKIGTLEKMLDPHRFLRIHRSFIVNLDRIKEVQPCGSGEHIVLLRSGKELPFGRTYHEQLDQFIRRTFIVGWGS